VAAALDATVLEIWTDVDGFMSGDPRIIDHTYLIERLTFSEAMELCNFGAKVLFPSTIFPVYQKNIPIRVKNTFNTASPGTYISQEK
jgi:aspartokinase/homoserine dehydrogenase 1